MNRREFAFLLKHPKAFHAMNFSFSNEGEDQALMKEIGFEKEKGFYIDVGANDPIKYSNTLGLYLRGWNGINIDAMPGSKAKFDKIRPRDINIESGVGTDRGTLTYYSFEESALNTFSSELMHEREKEGFSCISKQIVDILPLETILDEYMPQGQTIDIMDIDVEGMDFQVLKSNNWQKYRPTYVLAEAIGKSLLEVVEGDITKYMENVGYVPYMKFVGTVVYIVKEKN